MMILGPASAQGIYPDPPPVFGDPSDPLSEMFSSRGGQTDRPVLVVFAEFDDLSFNDTDPSSIDAAYLHERFFGAFPSVEGYFSETSNGHLQLTPAAESDTANNGAANDGIVSVSIDMDKGDFLSNGREAEQAMLLEAADPYVDYSQFDVDENGRITQDELIFVRQDVDPSPVPVGSGTARRPDPVELDGVILGSNNKDIFGTDHLVGVDAGTATNIMTIVHEIGHTAFDMPDTYFWDVASFDLGGGTSNLGDDVLFHNSAWQAMHLGWADPVVVTESGFYEVPRSPAGSSFILYDPEKGTDDFFIVENRAQTPGTYDQGASDTGLVVWQLDESEYHQVGAGEGFISLMRPTGFGTAWNPTLDPFHDHRTMDEVTWRDGTPANIAIRAISPADDTMRVYFDVRGPGLLVDPRTHYDTNMPIITKVKPGEETFIRVPVMNTGDEADTFEFDYTNLPPGWSSAPDVLELEPGDDVRAEPFLTPALDAETGVYELTVVGKSTTNPSVVEKGTLTVNVVLDISSIDYTGETYVPVDEPAGFSATVTNYDDDDAPIQGVEVIFELDGPGGYLSVTGITDSSGTATADPIIELPPGDYQLTASIERFGKHAPTATTENYRVPTVEERVGDLIDEVTAAGIHPGVENSLISKLEQSLKHVEAERSQPACNTLSAFINQVDALSGKALSEPLADDLKTDADGIRSQLGC